MAPYFDMESNLAFPDWKRFKIRFSGCLEAGLNLTTLYLLQHEFSGSTGVKSRPSEALKLELLYGDFMFFRRSKMSVITVFPFRSALYNRGQGHDSFKTLGISYGICLGGENFYIKRL
jgi:hypothetical protein